MKNFPIIKTLNLTITVKVFSCHVIILPCLLLCHFAFCHYRLVCISRILYKWNHSLIIIWLYWCAYSFSSSSDIIRDLLEEEEAWEASHRWVLILKKEACTWAWEIILLCSCFSNKSICAFCLKKVIILTYQGKDFHDYLFVFISA